VVGDLRAEVLGNPGGSGRGGDQVVGEPLDDLARELAGDRLAAAFGLVEPPAAEREGPRPLSG
jgi:hypothetical protein